MHGLLQTHTTGLFLEGVSGTSSLFSPGETEVSLLLSAGFPSPAPQVLLLNNSETGRACGIAVVSFEARKTNFIYRIGFHICLVAL